jgi:hypothetical protein
VNSWGSVTNNLSQPIGSVDRYGSFQSNLTPWYSNNVDRFGSISNGYNGIGTQIGKINNYDSYQRTNNLRTSMDYLNKKDQDDYSFGKFKKSYEPEYKMSKYEPFIPFKEPKVLFNTPASVPLLPYEPLKKKSFFDDDYSFKFKF